MSQKKRLDEISIARAIAITGVLCVHGFSTAVTQLENSSIWYPIYNLLNIVGKLGTPTFILLSSFILFYTYFNRTIDLKLITNFYMKRLNFILIPFVFFSLFYMVTKWILIDTITYSSISAFWDKLQFYLLWGKAHPHLYFVIISVQFYILFPLLLWLMKKSIIIRKYSIPIGFIIQWVWIYVNRHYLQVDYKGSIVFSYASFYFVGAYLGIYYEDIKSKMANFIKYRDKVITFVSVGLGIMLATYVGYNYLVRIGVWGDVSSKLPNFITVNIFEVTWGLYTMFAAIFILMISNYIAKSHHEHMKRFLTNIGIMSFGIYLIHPFFLQIFREIFVSGDSLLFHFYQLLTFILVYVISYYLVYFTYRYIPFSWIIFGKSEVKFKFSKKQ